MPRQGDSRAVRRAAVLAAGSAALGRTLTSPEPVRDSAWTVVLRCADPAGPAGSGSVIVKAYPPGPEGEAGFAGEAAGLALASDTRLAPELLAADRDSLTVVMSDLGRAPSLADALLSTGPEQAAQALLDWAEGCGRLAVAGAGREPELARLRRQYARDEPDGGTVPGSTTADSAVTGNTAAGNTTADNTVAGSIVAGLRERVLGAAERAVLAGVAVPDGLAAELAQVAATVTRSDCRVFSPGDICPDNNVLTPGGVRFIDFEESGHHSAFLDAAYLRMPFSTCWCVFRLPPGLRDEAEQRYRAQVARIWPRLADDATWQRGVRHAVAAWSMNSMWWLLGRALDGDASLEPGAVAAPGARQLMRHRWQVLADELEAGGELPAISAMARALLTATADWRADDLPLYPALRPAALA